MVVTIAPPPRRPRARSAPPRQPAAAPGLLPNFWPPGILPPREYALLARPYRTGRGVPAGQGKCDTCIALCCRYIAVEVDGPDVPKDFDLLRWFLLHENTRLFVEGRSWFLQFFTRCRALGSDNRCTIYHERPDICREYETDGCDRDEAQQVSKAGPVFNTLQELDAYRLTWMKRWESRRRRERREAALKGARTRRRRARARRG